MKSRGWVWLLALTAVGVAAELKIGSERAAQARAGVAMRVEPKSLAKIVTTLPYGTRVTVEEVKGYYARVKDGKGNVGWVRAADIVEPGSLTGAGAYGAGGAGNVSTPDVSAAGRQFDEDIEGKYRASDAQLEAAYREVDRIEKTAPATTQIEAFIREGRLGR